MSADVAAAAATEEPAVAAEYTVKDVARILDMQEARLRYWTQTGFVGPSVRRNGRFFYTFQDLIGVKAAKELLAGGLSLQTVRKNLEALRAALPQIDRPLARLRVCSDGDRIVVVADDDSAFEPTSGQLVMSFAVATLHDHASQLVPISSAVTTMLPTTAAPTVVSLASHAATAATATAAAPESAYACFLAALRAEDAAHDDASAARRAETLYRRALLLDESLAAAWTNLGNLCERRGARGEAREAYQRALALDPEQPEARYNYANLLADLGRADLALVEYRRVTAAAPEFADAHFNLGMLLARRGQVPAARTHLERYLELDPDSEWAAQARAALG